MIRLSIIGSGNVAHHLMRAFSQNSEVELVQVLARNPLSISSVISTDKIISDFKALCPVDLTIIAVTDKEIADVSERIPSDNRLVVHTSGSIAIETLAAKNRKGVFYPLQTFSKGKEIDFKTIPICIEAQQESDFELLKTVAKSISNSVYDVNSQQRKALHVAAVFVSNFTNHLYHIGNELCEENKLPFSILIPLILETAQKIVSLAPKEAQTGPAKRMDTLTINSHLDFLTDENQKEIYKMLTKSIIDNGKKL